MTVFATRGNATHTRDASGSAPGRQPAAPAPGPAVDALRAVQRSLGNGYLQRTGGCADPERDGGSGGGSCGGGGCASGGGGGCAGCTRRRVQGKLTVGAAGDPYEREADRVADQIVRSPAPAPGEIAAPDAPPVAIRRLDAGASTGAGELPEVALPVGGGHPLAAATRAFMEPRFGQDFGDVRVHTGPGAHSAAARIQARAFTHEHHIFLRGGENEHDHHLIAHELTHVVQQRGGAALLQRAITPELDQIESYLSYGVFDWAITDEEALRALALLKTLSRYQQAVFFSDPTNAHRLRDNLPDGRVAELDALQADAGALQAPTATVEAIQDRLSYGLFDWAITDRDAVEALEMLKQLSGVQLATAIGSINYGRLLDNLPDARKPELTELWDRAMGFEGPRQTSEQENPGTVLSSITFHSDHGLMKQNDDDWTSTGAPPPRPEWFLSGGKPISHPISQDRNSNVVAEVSLNVTPLGAPAAPIRFSGRSLEPALNFDFAGTMTGGLNQKMVLTSTGKLPDTIRTLNDRTVAWTLEWGGWKHEIGRTTHTIFVTVARPLIPSEVTTRRMRLAVSLTERVADENGTLDPHPLVRGIMRRWGAYDLNIKYPNNAWELADNLDAGAQCIDIVRFVNGLLQTIGSPGTSTAIVVWAKPGSPTVPERSVWPHGGLRTVGPHPAHPDWFAGLMDINGCPNAYEAALEFIHGGVLRYYPGGVSMNRLYTTVLDVLHVFQCFAWRRTVGTDEFDIEEIMATYPNGRCRLGWIRCDR